MQAVLPATRSRTMRTDMVTHNIYYRSHGPKALIRIV